MKVLVKWHRNPGSEPEQLLIGPSNPINHDSSDEVKVVTLALATAQIQFRNKFFENPAIGSLTSEIIRD
jgi:hypothetical protein